MHDPAAVLSVEERAHLQQKLRTSMQEVVQFCHRLQPNDWNRSDGEGRWTIAGIVEHLAIIEARIGDRVRGMLSGESEPRWRELTAGNEARIAAVAVPQQKIESPPAGHPSGKTGPESLAAFARLREETLALADDTSVALKQYVAAHPLGWMLNAHQWLLITAAHTRRHLVQMQRSLDSAQAGR